MTLDAFRDELAATAAALAAPGTGLLAADESTATIGKRFEAIALENTEANRRAYCTLLATTPGLPVAISGVILTRKPSSRPARPTALLSSSLDKLNNHYILADNWDQGPFRYFAEKVDGLPDWSAKRMPCGHNIVIDIPAELFNCLLSLGWPRYPCLQSMLLYRYIATELI